jgi:outer membrane protein TolC
MSASAPALLTKGRVADSLRAGSSTTGLETLSEIVGFDGGWELDIFGKYRRLLEAARDDTQALAEMRHAVLTTVIAEVVPSYVNIHGLEARLEFARNNVATAQKTLDIVQTRFDRGLTSEFDVTLAKRQLAVLQARPSDPTAAILDARSRMAILLGTCSEEIAPELGRRRGIPRIPDYLQPGGRSICCGGAPIFAKPNAKSPRRRRGSARQRLTCSPPYRSPSGSAPKGGPGSSSST